MPKIKKLQIIGKFPSGEIDHAEVRAIVNDYLVKNPPKPQITINGKGPDENGNFVVDGDTGASDGFAYNFTTINEWSTNPEDVQALDNIIRNWPKEPMSLYVMGYPVIGVDINNHHFKVLKDDRFLYTFNWEINRDHTKCRIFSHAVVELIDRNYVDKQYANVIHCDPQTLTPEQQAQARANIGAAAVDAGGIGVKIETDNTLKLENGVLSVNTTNLMEQDNTLPITSAGVYATVGNIEALLKTI